HIGTDIVLNSRRIHSTADGEEGMIDLSDLRRDLARRGLAADGMSDDELRNLIQAMAEGFRDNAPVSAAQAASVILDGVRAGKWRILVGDDAHALDEAVRADPEAAYAPDGLSLATVFGRGPG